MSSATTGRHVVLAGAVVLLAAPAGAEELVGMRASWEELVTSVSSLPDGSQNGEVSS